MATLQFSERRSLIRSGLDGSNTSAALHRFRGTVHLVILAESSGTGSVPTTAATLRMCPRA